LFALNGIKTASNDQADIRHTILVAAAIRLEEDLAVWMSYATVVLAPVPATTKAFLDVEVGTNSLEDLALRRCHSSRLHLGYRQRRAAAWWVSLQ
jgi:hypothetical protein